MSSISVTLTLVRNSRRRSKNTLVLHAVIMMSGRRAARMLGTIRVRSVSVLVSQVGSVGISAITMTLTLMGNSRRRSKDTLVLHLIIVVLCWLAVIAEMAQKASTGTLVIALGLVPLMLLDFVGSQPF